MDPVDIYDNLSSFGQTPSEMYLDYLRTRFNEKCFVLQGDTSSPTACASCLSYRGIATLKSGTNTNVDLSPYVTGITSTTECRVVLIVGKPTTDTVTIKFCGSETGAAYSETTTVGTATYIMHPYVAARFRITYQNYENNCKLRFTSSNSSGTKFACVVLLFYYKTGKTIDTEE